jgi:hypothetical protein
VVDSLSGERGIGQFGVGAAAVWDKYNMQCTVEAKMDSTGFGAGTIVGRELMEVISMVLDPSQGVDTVL